MTRLACWSRKSGSRPSGAQGVPTFRTKTRSVYDALRRGEEVKNFWGLLKLIDLYNMEAEQVTKTKRGTGPKNVIYYRLKGEWHDHKFYPLDRVGEIKAEELDFTK